MVAPHQLFEFPRHSGSNIDATVRSVAFGAVRDWGGRLECPYQRVRCPPRWTVRKRRVTPTFLGFRV